jgi:hypothetical protein
VLHPNLLYLDLSYQCNNIKFDCNASEFQINRDLFKEMGMGKLKVRDMGTKLNFRRNSTLQYLRAYECGDVQVQGTVFGLTVWREAKQIDV